MKYHIDQVFEGGKPSSLFYINPEGVSGWSKLVFTDLTAAKKKCDELNGLGDLSYERVYPELRYAKQWFK